MDVSVLRQAADLVYEAVRGMAGTAESAGDNGIGAGGDISRNIDVLAEKTVLDHLWESGIPCTVLGEECGRVEVNGGGGFVLMDAIDGSANAVRGVPFFNCSLAYAEEDKISSITAGVVKNLAGGDSYWAERGAGCFRNGTRVHVRACDPIYRIVGVNTSGAGPGILEELGPVFLNNHTRHFGANALEMAMCAAGTIDACVDYRGKIRVLDLAAGYILVREAGGIVLDRRMRPLESDLGYGNRLSFAAASGEGTLRAVLGI